MFQRISYGFFGGLALAAVIVAALAITDTRVHDLSSGGVSYAPSPEAAQAFVDDWQRMRRGTWSVDSTFVRTSNDGRTFNGEIHEAQRPPERVRTAFGTTTIEQPGRKTVCTADSENAKGGCRTAPSSASYNDAVESDIQNVRSLIVGVSPAYSVAQTSRHCYRLSASGGQMSTTWGHRAAICFDAETGAVRSSEILKGDVTDTTTATSVDRHVSDSEFQRAKDLT